MTPLETAVRARLRESLKPIVGTRPELDEAALDRMVEDKLGGILPVLREHFPDDASPSLDQIHAAELEVTKRIMRNMIGLMTDPVGQAMLNAAQAELNAAPAPEPAPDLQAEELEARLAELEARLGGDAGGTPTPQ